MANSVESEILFNEAYPQNKIFTLELNSLGIKKD
jgi:hypothetical protein